MDYYIIKNNFDKAGAPAILNAVLAEKFAMENPMPPMSGYEWTKSKDLDIKFPDELFLISKDKFYDFNYNKFWKGFIVSEQFKIFLDKYFLEFKTVNLKVINLKGKNITKNQYYFIYIPMKNRLSIIDYNASKFELDLSMLKLRGLSEDEVKKDNNFFGNIKEYKKLVIDKTNKLDIFQLKDIVIQDLICSSKFKNDCIEMPNINFINTFNMDNYNNYYM